MLSENKLPLMLGKEPILVILHPIKLLKLMCLACCVITAAPQAFANAEELFGTSERQSSRLKSFPKWNNMLARYEQEVTARLPCTKPKECQMNDWNSFMAGLQDKDFHTKINEVNTYLNKIDYVTDPTNWGLPDYWEVPYEFHIKDGDCEDYAISKYMSLKSLGILPQDMRIVILKDENLNVHHAILAVYHETKVYILDNQISNVVTDEDIHHYRPIYSINEEYWWRHR